MALAWPGGRQRWVQSKVGEGSGKCDDEAEEFNVWWCNKMAAVVKSDWEPVTGGPLKDWRDGQMDGWGVGGLMDGQMVGWG